MFLWCSPCLALPTWPWWRIYLGDSLGVAGKRKHQRQTARKRHQQPRHQKQKQNQRTIRQRMRNRVDLKRRAAKRKRRVNMLCDICRSTPTAHVIATQDNFLLDHRGLVSLIFPAIMSVRLSESWLESSFDGRDRERREVNPSREPIFNQDKTTSGKMEDAFINLTNSHGRSHPCNPFANQAHIN